MWGEVKGRNEAAAVEALEIVFALSHLLDLLPFSPTRKLFVVYTMPLDNHPNLVLL
jgi:hypothetical protein